MTFHFKRYRDTGEHRMYICDGDLQHAHTTKTTTNKTKTITDYWGGNCIKVDKSICSCQLRSSLQSDFMLYLHGNAFVCGVHSVSIFFVMRVMFCNCLRFISRCVTFMGMLIFLFYLIIWVRFGTDNFI